MTELNPLHAKVFTLWPKSNAPLNLTKERKRK